MSHGRGKHYFGYLGFVGSWCKSRKTRACSGSAMEECPRRTDAEPFGFLIWPCKNITADFCKTAALGLSSWLWYVSPDHGWSSSCEPPGQPCQKMPDLEVPSVASPQNNNITRQSSEVSSVWWNVTKYIYVRTALKCNSLSAEPLRFSLFTALFIRLSHYTNLYSFPFGATCHIVFPQLPSQIFNLANYLGNKSAFPLFSSLLNISWLQNSSHDLHFWHFFLKITLHLL